MLLIKCCFQCLWFRAVLGINCLVFLWKGLIIEDSLPVPPCTHITFPWMKTDAGLAGTLSLASNLSQSTLYSIYFSSPITSCFKIRIFLLYLSGESHLEIHSRWVFVVVSSVFFFFFLFNLCRTEASKGWNLSVTNVFEAWLGNFEYVGYLLHV